jgi:hypothetical protein
MATPRAPGFLASSGDPFSDKHSFKPHALALGAEWI